MDRFRIGPRVRALREERRLTQRELAARASLSTNAISLIERDQISPSVGTLQHLAAALNVRMSFFFDAETTPEVIHIRAGQGARLESGGVTIQPAAAHLAGQHMEPFLVDLAPGAHAGADRCVHAGQELACCLAGEIEYVVDRTTYLLSRGDYLLFRAELPHSWRNPRDEPARMLLVLENPSGLSDSVRLHFAEYPSLAYLSPEG